MDRISPSDLSTRLATFAAERHPFAVERVRRALADALAGIPLPIDADALDRLGARLGDELRSAPPPFAGLGETTPGVTAASRWDRALEALADDVRGFLRREALRIGLSAEERREILAGMVLTRAVDNRLKTFFTGSEVRYGSTTFQGKGYRSLGQEAIYGAAIRLRRGDDLRDGDGRWTGDIVAPMIRDLGAVLAMGTTPAARRELVRQTLGAQMAKAGSPMDGRDLHLGDWSRGVLPPAAPLSISPMTATGLGWAFARGEGERRVALAFVGEGATSLGEWHEAINVAAVERAPVVFCVQNNQTALATPVRQQTAVRTFADKAAGYGMPGVTLDGTDADDVAAAFAWAVERARRGDGPCLLELVAMRMCGHAHHDDMLYLGREPKVSRSYPELHPSGYADPERWAFWSERDPIVRLASRLADEGQLEDGELDAMWEEAEALVEEEAQAVVAADWPDATRVGHGVDAESEPARRVEVLDPRPGLTWPPPALPDVEEAGPFDPAGSTFLDAVARGIGDALEVDPDVFVYGEDVGGAYGNAFLLLRPLLERHGDRIRNSPLTEAGTLGVAIGAALAGRRPIAEIQFNDFVATGFNQLVNNAAKIRWRWGAEVPMVVRLPWGGLRHAGPYHSQCTEAWFHRVPGLQIVAPSTPHDARALLRTAVESPDPVLYYEHIALYRDPRVKQVLPDERPDAIPLGTAALRRAGEDLAMVSWGPYVHRALDVAERLASDGIEASVLDLRSLVPLDRDRLLAVARACGRVLIVHEDTRRGSIGESLAAVIQEEAFEYLDAPIRILGALDTPVPYAPSLEAAFLPSVEELERAARLLAAY